MRGSLKKAAVATALTTAFVVGGSTAANAITYYPPGTDIYVSASLKSPRTLVLTVAGGVFKAGRTVYLRIPRSFGARFGEISQADATWTVTTNAQGGVDPVTITVPEDVAGTFTVTAESDEKSITSSFNINPEEVVAAATNGVDGVAIGLWVAGGAAGLAAVALAGSALAKRREEFAF